MTTLRQLRNIATSLPDVTSGTHFGLEAYRVRGRVFASVTRDGGAVQLWLPEDAVAEIRACNPAAEPITRQERTIGVRLPLADVDARRLNDLVRRAWLSQAPQRLVAETPAAETAELGVRELSTAIGRPATRALQQAGIMTLEAVARHSRKELLALHGVGPKAIRVLAGVLGERGSTFRDESIDPSSAG
ncbi:MmcQ/YjbR family DNA-binding protein [Prescottella soli]|uniref:MmcQ/YjbR family DNA-binding protein n=1 Tax=Prescottella soli TaxID=1543852 RepID=A0ABW9FSC3_9NOCA